MERVVVEESVARRFAEFSDVVEVVAPDGQLLGRYIPGQNPYTEGEQTDDEPTAEQLDEIERNCKRWYTSEEVMARLRSLG